MKTKTFLFLLALTAHGALAQTSSEAAVSAALQNHPLAKAAAFETQAKKHLEKAAVNLPNPELNAESPTGEFYALGVLQSFEFPTVYVRQKQLAKAETALAQADQQISAYEVRYVVRSLYLDAQVADYQARQWAERDSLYQQIAAVAVRQFEGGEIDFLQKTMAENEAGKVHQDRLAAGQMATALRLELATYSGIAELGSLQPLLPDTSITGLPVTLQQNPQVVYSLQAAEVAAQQARLAKSRALPNFSVGYLNQGVRSTPTDYRFRASVGIPLWAGQYRAGTNAAKVETQAALARAEAQTQALQIEWQRTQTDYATALAKLQYQEREALPRSRALIEAVLRMREAGQVDYITLLRTLDEAYAIQREYATQVQELNRAQLRLRYLTGE